MASKTSAHSGILPGPRAQRLFEVSGHWGPWSPEEFAAAGVASAVNQPPPESRDELPDDVREALDAREAAKDAYDAAYEAWSKTARDIREFRATGRSGGMAVYQPDDPRGAELNGKLKRKMNKLHDAELEARDVRDRAGDDLVRAKVAEQRARNRWTRARGGGPVGR